MRFIPPKKNCKSFFFFFLIKGNVPKYHHHASCPMQMALTMPTHANHYCILLFSARAALHNQVHPSRQDYPRNFNKCVYSQALFECLYRIDYRAWNLASYLSSKQRKNRIKHQLSKREVASLKSPTNFIFIWHNLFQAKKKGRQGETWRGHS